MSYRKNRLKILRHWRRRAVQALALAALPPKSDIGPSQRTILRLTALIERDAKP